MPAEIYGEKYEFLPKSDVLTFEEIGRVAKVFVNMGVKKIRLTGGEPLVRQGIEDLIRILSKIEGLQDLTLTTNGYLLFEKAESMKDAGLQRVTVSLDSLNEDVFKQMNGRGYGVEKVLAGISKASEVGLSPIKINVVVKKDLNDKTILDLAKYFKGTTHIVRFIEYMDVGNINGWKPEHVVPLKEMIDLIGSQVPIVPIDANYKGEVALRYRYADNSGEIGFIASVTNPFCGDCTRIRLSTDGKLYTCLFGTRGVELRKPIRDGASDEDIRNLITKVWANREDRYSEMRNRLSQYENDDRKIEMYQIGG